MTCRNTCDEKALESAENMEELTGFEAPDEEAVTVPESERWISRRLIKETRRVWSKRYGRLISQEEAVEILINVRNFAVLFLGRKGG